MITPTVRDMVIVPEVNDVVNAKAIEQIKYTWILLPLAVTLLSCRGNIGILAE